MVARAKLERKAMESLTRQNEQLEEANERLNLWFLLDQVARILLGTKVIPTIAKWSNGTTELRVRLGDPSADYIEWVAKMKAGEDGPDTYDYDEGIPP